MADNVLLLSRMDLAYGRQCFIAIAYGLGIWPTMFYCYRVWTWHMADNVLLLSRMDTIFKHKIIYRLLVEST